MSVALEGQHEVRIVRADGWFKLHVGRFASRGAASADLRRVREAGYPDAWVTDAPATLVATVNAASSRTRSTETVITETVTTRETTTYTIRSPETDAPPAVESVAVRRDTVPAPVPAERAAGVPPEQQDPPAVVAETPPPVRAEAPPAERPPGWVPAPVRRAQAEPRVPAPVRVAQAAADSVAREPEPAAVAETEVVAEAPEAQADPATEDPSPAEPETAVATASTASGLPDLSARRVPIDLHRTAEPISLDGVIDDPVWRDVQPFPITVYSPTYGQDPTERSEFRVAYDDEYIYVAGALYDSDPSGIQANTFYRDGGRGDDEFTIVFDSYNDYETGLSFSANANGARTDRSIANDGQFVLGQPTQNSDWNAHWDLATTRNDQGWFAEMRIPFSSLGFQVVDDEVVMGMSVYRSIGRKNERHVFPDVSPAWGFFGFGKPSLQQRVRFRGVQRRAPLYITPYLLGGVTRTPELVEPPDVESAGYVFDNDYTREPGVDIKWSPTPSLTVDLTANTDFAQVEADDQQINLTRFPLFFPEKRQFFQSRSSTFDFGTGGFTDRLFFSRRIGLDRGQLVRIYGGARLVGQIGGLDYGILNMQTASQGGRPGENMGVFRVKQQILNPFSSIGGMVTTRLGDTGENNVAYGIDTEIRPFGDEYVTVKWAQTFDEAIAEGSVLDAGLIRARWERRRQDGFYYAAEYGRVGPDYLPRLGFQSRRDFSLFGGEANYSWFLGPSSALRTVTVGASTQHYYRNADQSAESRSISPNFLVGLKSGGFFILSATSSFESIREPFTAAGLQIDPGEYWFHEGSMSFRLPRSQPIRGNVSLTGGSFYDGRRIGMNVQPSFNITSHLAVQPSYGTNRFEFDGESLTTHLASLRLDFALNTHLSLSAFGQYNSVVDQSSINARLRYHFSEGTDLWIVYNEGFNLERDAGFDPRLPLSAGRSILVKYSHTLGF